MSKQKVLGKGLSALMGMQEDAVESSKIKSKIFLPIDDLSAGKYQPRRYFTEENLKELSESIAQKGILLPLIVRSKDETGKYEIIAGERRWRASKLVGLKEVPAIIKEIDDNEALEFALIENIQRQDLSPIEEAEGYQRLIDEFSYSNEKLAKMLSKSRSHIANLLRLLSLPQEIKTMVNESKLSMGHARALINADDPIGLAQKIIKSGLSVRKTENLVKNENKPIKVTAAKLKDFSATNLSDLEILENSLSESLKMPVSIYDTEDGGKLTISFNTLGQLDLLLQKLG